MAECPLKKANPIKPYKEKGTVSVKQQKIDIAIVAEPVDLEPVLHPDLMTGKPINREAEPCRRSEHVPEVLAYCLTIKDGEPVSIESYCRRCARCIVVAGRKKFQPQ